MRHLLIESGIDLTTMPDRAIQMLQGISQVSLPPERVIAALMNLDALEEFHQICNQYGLSIPYCETAACIARYSLDSGWTLEQLAVTFEFSKQMLTYSLTPEILVSVLNQLELNRVENPDAVDLLISRAAEAVSIQEVFNNLKELTDHASAYRGEMQKRITDLELHEKELLQNLAALKGRLEAGPQATQKSSPATDATIRLESV
jgi:hypothetical protein